MSLSIMRIILLFDAKFHIKNSQVAVKIQLLNQVGSAQIGGPVLAQMGVTLHTVDAHNKARDGGALGNFAIQEE